MLRILIGFVIIGFVLGYTIPTGFEKIVSWVDYSGLIKDQISTEMCWAFAVSSYLEMSYYILTGSRYLLSAQQISDNLPNYFSEYPDGYCSTMIRPAFNAGYSVCAMYYVEHSGIMTEYNYPFVQGGESSRFRSKFITPVGITNITQEIICSPYNKTCTNINVSYIINLLNNGSFVSSVYVDNSFSSLMSDTLISGNTNHEVHVIGLYLNTLDGCYYLMFQNSYSALWGNYGGYGFIRITDSNHTVINNRGILYMIKRGIVYDKFVNNEVVQQSETTPEQKSGIIVSNYVIIGIISFIFLCVIGIIVYVLIKCRISKSHLLLNEIPNEIKI